MDALALQDSSALSQIRFEAAVKVIKSLPPDGSFQPSNDMMLKFYSFYKQATAGPCNIPRPGFWDAVGKAKWDAWNSLGGMSKEEAMTSYVDEMKLILEGMPITQEVEDLLKVLGPFYELVEEKKKISQISDLSTARLTKFARQLEGIGSMMSSVSSKSIARNIVRTMEMNGSLERRQEQQEEPASSEGEEEEEEAVEEAAVEEAALTQGLTGEGEGRARSKGPLSNGDVANGEAYFTNGGPTPEDSEWRPEVNGHHTDPGRDVSDAHHLTSDSDSEVYCDSMDQFGQEESSVCCQDDPDEEAQGPPHLQGPPEGVRCGGEEGENSGRGSERRGHNEGVTDRPLARGGRAPRAPGHSSRAQRPLQGGGDGGRERGGGQPAGGSLDAHIMVALSRLQEDMQSVLDRLHTLEALTSSQARSPGCSTHATTRTSKNPSWWPLEVSPGTAAIALIWPFVVQWLISFYGKRRRTNRD